MDLLKYLLAGAVVCVNVSTASAAAFYQIDDAAGFITVIRTDTNQIVASGTELTLLTWTHLTGGPQPASSVTVVNILDSPGGVISDQFITRVTQGSALTELSFASNPALFNPLPPDFTLVEDGSFQNIPGGPSCHFPPCVSMRSDATGPQQVPEPETYAMLLAGLGALGMAARRRKLKVAA